MLQDYPVDPLVERETTARLEAGAHKYGKSWCEVDLREDLLEELYDVLNYCRMMVVRYRAIYNGEDYDDPVANKMGTVLTGLMADTTDHILAIRRFVPEFEGPTSAEWAAAHAEGG
jgi:hypothetical protein